MLLVDFTLASPILAHALSAVPEMTVTHQRWEMTTEREVRVLLWAATDDAARFDVALDTDPTVTDETVLGEINGQRLYRLRLLEEGRAVSVYPVVVESGTICHELRGTHSGWDCRMSFLDRDALELFHSFCRTHELGFELRSLHEEHSRFESELYGLTPKQYEALSLAFEQAILRCHAIRRCPPLQSDSISVVKPSLDASCAPNRRCLPPSCAESTDTVGQRHIENGVGISIRCQTSYCRWIFTYFCPTV